MKLLVEIKSPDVKSGSGTDKKSGEPYNWAKQSGWLTLPKNLTLSRLVFASTQKTIKFLTPPVTTKSGPNRFGSINTAGCAAHRS